MTFDGQTEKIELEALAEFDKMTEWKKDAWHSERGFASNILDYLDCAKILHGEDDWLINELECVLMWIKFILIYNNKNELLIFLSVKLVLPFWTRRYL